MMWKTAATAASGSSEAEQQRDQAEVADRRIGQQALEVVLEDARRTRRPSSVARPVPPTTPEPGSVPASAGYSRASRKTPAFTMVAECR